MFGPPPRKTANRKPRRRKWFRQRNGKAYQHVEINVHRFYIDGASSRLFWSKLWHLLGESSGREPFPVSPLLLMDTPHWKIFAVYTVRMVLLPTAAPCFLREFSVLLFWVIRAWLCLRVSQEEVVLNSFPIEKNMMLTQLQDVEEQHNIVAHGYDFGAFPAFVNGLVF